MEAMPPTFDAADLISQGTFLRALARSLVHGEEDDLAQEAVTRALRRPPAEGTPLGAWLAGVVRNLGREHRRAETRRRRREREAARPEALPSTADTVARLDLVRVLAEAVQGLAEPYRTVVLLRFYEGLPPREIASRLEVPVATVRTRILRALETLRLRLDRHEGGDRQAWLTGLAPLALLRPAVATSGLLATLGVLLMSLPAKLMLGGGAFAALLLWSSLPRDPSGPPASAIDADGQARIEAGPLQEPGSPDAVGEASGATGRMEPPGSRRESLEPDEAAARVIVIRGHVHDRQGEPIAGARVLSASDPEYGAVSTGEDGAYVLRLGRSFGDKVLWVQAEGMAWLEELVEVPVGRLRLELDFVLHAGFELGGRVVDEDGAPVAGASVSVSPRGGGDVDCDEQGRFVLEGLDPATEVLRLRATAEDMQPARLVWRQGQSRSGVELRLERGRVLRGRVVDAHEAPVPGAWIMAAPALSNVNEWACGSDEDGRFELRRLPAGELEVLVQCTDGPEGGFTPWFARVDADRQAARELVVRLGRGGMLRGLVIDQQGRPVRDASIGYDVGRVSVRQCWSSDADGRFVVDRVPEGRVLLRCRKQGYCEAEAISTASGATDLRFVLAHRAGFRGRVVDADSGLPVHDFRVRLLEPELRPGETAAGGLWSQWFEEGLRFQDDEGRFTSGDEELREGDLVALLVSAEGYAPTRVARLVCAAEPDEIGIGLHAGRALPLRLVAEADGRPLAGARVRRIPAWESLRLSQHESPWGSSFATADAEGRLRFTGVGSEEFSLYVEHPAVGRRLLGPLRPAPRDGEIALRLGRAGGVEGRLSAAGGVAVPNATLLLRAVAVRGASAFELEARTDREGRFRIDGVPDGRWVLTWLERREPFSAIRLARELEVRAGEAAKLDLGLDMGKARLRVAVVSTEALPRPLALSIRPRGEAPFACRGGLFEGPTTELGGLPAGRYEVEVSHWDYRSNAWWQGKAEVTLDATGRTELRVDLVHRD